MLQYEALFNHASMGIVVLDNKGMIRSANPYALKLFGYEPGELTGKAIEVLIPQRYHHRHVGHREGYTHHPNNRPMGLGMDLFAIKKDGTEFPVEVSLGNYQDKGEVSVIAFVSDISIRKRTEAQIEKMNAELEATVVQRTRDLQLTLDELKTSRGRLQELHLYQKALLDNAGVMIIATDEHGIIRLFNPEASARLGYDEAEVIGKASITLLHAPDQESDADLFNTLVAGSEQGLHEDAEYNYITKDGVVFPVSLTISAVKDEQGKVTGFVAVAIDIAARKQAEKELHKALEKEKELNELKSGFVSMASHEFRTPLSTILSSTYLIEKYIKTEEQPSRDRHLGRIKSSVAMLTEILNDFLSVGKIEEGKIQVRPAEFDIHETVESVIEEVRHNLKKQQGIHYTHEGEAVFILDVSLLKHILMNLLSNAGKFSPENSTIEVRTSCHNKQFLLAVKDHGIGISKEDQQHLMERFFRGANAANIQGTGLGLHIVSKYAELMHGKVTCNSEIGKGTEFIIVFQAKQNGE
ncbi:His Kinase A (phospho-acceptor) domain-containing protein [Sediminibacterium ginsengisoli]|uniref:histidine kinase n=2 Tax=Sediminibacterium ginsengisoli TaxID=413434 RepID=A0A1T4LD39_9BACT|nr:His Kinase A (phospho-acceptor) domain-containing protein [Sediminibacterium ginsengisoli]